MQHWVQRFILFLLEDNVQMPQQMPLILTLKYSIR